MTIAMRLVLWDIDGTLVDVFGHGRRAFARGIQRAWGVVDDLADVRFAGATDLAILAALRARATSPLALPEEHTSAFFAHMAAALDELLREGPPAEAVAGAVDVVHALRARGGVMQGLVTGNARVTAVMKLRRAGLPVDAFVHGAFGDEHHDRDELARRALARANERVVVTHVTLVGDTVSDVKAARAIGAVPIALCRRPGEREALVDAGAAHVVDRLSEVLPLLLVDDAGS